MNKFREYVYNPSFKLNLSGNMVKALLSFTKDELCTSVSMNTYSSLVDRGLVVWEGKFLAITAEGDTVNRLLLAAGYKVCADE